MRAKVWTVACGLVLGGLSVEACRGCADPERPRGAVEASGADARAAAEAPDTGPAVDAWREVRSEQGRFSVSFPSEPTHERSLVNAPGGVEVELHTWQVDEEASPRILRVSYEPLTGALADAADPAAALAAFVDEQRRGPRRTVERERPLSLAGFRGHELVMRSEDLGSDQVDVTWQVYLAHGRLYQLMAMAQDGPTRERARRFLASFTLAPAVAGEDTSPRDAWAPFEAAQSGFDGVLPASPLVTASREETPWGDREVQRYSADGSFPPAHYTVAVVRVGDALAELPRPEAFDRWEAFTLREGGPDGSPLTLEERGAIPLAGLTARSLRVTFQRDGETATARFVGLPVGDRFYTISAAPHRGELPPAALARFLGGFTLRP